jgi:hypothetical protein
VSYACNCKEVSGTVCHRVVRPSEFAVLCTAMLCLLSLWGWLVLARGASGCKLRTLASSASLASSAIGSSLQGPAR